jgi:dTMP kinase
MNARQPSPHPVFITLDGIDGVGKTTQIERLSEHLHSLGHQVLCVRDPGGTVIGSQLRKILLDSDCELHRRTEAMLFMASRCEMIETILRPAIQSGQTIISDRFLLANVVYQSIGGEVTADQLWQMGNWACDGLRPDLTLLLDMPAAAAMKRFDQPADRMEARGVDYLSSVRQAFLDQLPHSSDATAVINADQTPETVSKELRTSVDAFLDAASRR